MSTLIISIQQSWKFYPGQISKKNILALFNGRNESEIILDPNHLMNVIKLEEPCQDFTQSESFNQNM